jgi:hypothetical protein
MRMIITLSSFGLSFAGGGGTIATVLDRAVDRHVILDRRDLDGLGATRPETPGPWCEGEFFLKSRHDAGQPEDPTAIPQDARVDLTISLPTQTVSGLRTAEVKGGQLIWGRARSAHRPSRRTPRPGTPTMTATDRCPAH